MLLTLIISTLLILLIIFFATNYIKKKKQKIIKLEKQIIDLKIEKENIVNKIESIPFSYFETFDFEIFDKTLHLKKFETKILDFTKGLGGKGSSYLDFFDNQLYLVTANGLIAKTKIKNINFDKFDMKIVKNNLDKYLNQRLKFTDLSYLAYGIKDIMIEADKIYISFTDEIKKNCFNISILEGKISNENIKFKYFFKPDNCIKKNTEQFFSLHQSGGRIINLNHNNLLLSVGEFRSRLLAQKTNNINGKIIKINKINKTTKIISIGHRNPQGLFFDKESNYIYVSEHGPKGGDEINIITNQNKILNFGWPIASYGEHYKREGEDNSEIYKLAPLYKSHSDFGFIEPEKSFTPSIGISELILLNLFDEKILIVSSLGYDLTEGDMSLHLYKVNKQNLENYKVIPLKERIRDMIYLKDKKMIILFLETSTSIGVIKL